jgi:bifunctional DNA-binding transcriptional regulator/antitoxin component of YhaV-PrlF toxin-antitoxin module
MTPDVAGESTVTERFSVTIPPAVRREAGVEPGDTIRWRVDDAGSLSVELCRQEYGAFDDLDAVDIGEPTNVADDHDYITDEL